MSFTGKATYSAGADLPEIAEDVSDVIGIVSPYETPLLDALGDPMREAQSTHHEWLEDQLLPNKSRIDYSSFIEPSSDNQFDVVHGERFRTGDQIQVQGSRELMLVTNVDGNTITVERGYGGSEPEDLQDNLELNILGNAALEGSDSPQLRFTNRIRRGNYTQIFSAAVKVSGTDMAANQLGLADELDYQKQERLRELVRDLENTVINGARAVDNPQGTAAVRRTMQGIIQSLSVNVFDAADTDFSDTNVLNEKMINTALREIWEKSSGNVDLIVVNGFQKRKINEFCADSRSYAPSDTVLRNVVNVYESDFGLCRIVTSRWVPPQTVLFLDSSRVNVLPLTGRSFHFKPLSSTGDYECGELIGEYTLELKNESAHGIIHNLYSG